MELRERPTSQLRCAWCHGPAAGAVACARCGTLVHADCGTQARRCPTLGCLAPPAAPEPPRRARAVAGTLLRALALTGLLMGGCCLLPTAGLMHVLPTPGWEMAHEYLAGIDRAELLAAARPLMRACGERERFVHWRLGPGQQQYAHGRTARPWTDLPEVLRRPAPACVLVSREDVRLVWNGNDLGHGIVLLPEGDPGRELRNSHGSGVGVRELSPGVWTFSWHVW